MKKYLTFCIVSLLGFNSPAYSDTALRLSLEELRQLGGTARVCISYSTIAGAIMLRRLWGHSPSDIIANAHDEDKNFTEALVFLAFETPRYQSDIVRQRAVEDFENMVEIECLKIFTGR